MPETRLMVKSLLRWFAANARDLPWRRTRDPYAIWVSEIMLQQTQVKTVIPYWERWMKRFPRVEILAAAPMSQVLKLWEGLGYYSRARQLHKASKIVVKEHGGNLPRDYEEILSLPGVGRYTAGALCSIAFDQPAPILDGNVIRVLSRVHGIDSNPKEKQTNARLWQLAGALVSCAATLRMERRRTCSELNQALMELGALVCTPRNPGCEICPLRRLCRAKCENRQHELPHLGSRPVVTARRFVAFVVSRGERVLVRRRPDGGHNARLWEFPNIDVTGAERVGEVPSRAGLPSRMSEVERLVIELFGQAVGDLSLLCRVKHSITRYRITIEVFQGKMLKRHLVTNVGKWLRIGELEKLAFPSAHRRILDRLRDGNRNVGSFTLL